MSGGRGEWLKERDENRKTMELRVVTWSRSGRPASSVLATQSAHRGPRLHLDPFVALWSMCNALRRDRLPDRRVVIRFDFTGRQRSELFWLPIEHGETEICKKYPGLDEDLYITAEAEAFVKWHAGQLTWAAATRDCRIQLDGPAWLVRASPTWNARSMFADIKPISQRAASDPG